MLVFLDIIFQNWLILHKIVQFRYLLSKYRLPDLHIVLKSVIFFSKPQKTKIVPFNYLNTLHKENATLINIKVDKIPVTLTCITNKQNILSSMFFLFSQFFIFHPEAQQSMGKCIKCFKKIS